MKYLLQKTLPQHTVAVGSMHIETEQILQCQDAPRGAGAGAGGAGAGGTGSTRGLGIGYARKNGDMPIDGLVIGEGISPAHNAQCGN